MAPPLLRGPLPLGPPRWGFFNWRFFLDASQQPPNVYGALPIEAFFPPASPRTQKNPEAKVFSLSAGRAIFVHLPSSLKNGKTPKNLFPILRVFLLGNTYGTTRAVVFEQRVPAGGRVFGEGFGGRVAPLWKKRVFLRGRRFFFLAGTRSEAGLAGFFPRGLRGALSVRRPAAKTLFSGPFLP